MKEDQVWVTQSPEHARAMTERIFAAADTRAVWSEPIERGGYTVITASEAIAGGGFGFGSGAADRMADGASEAPARSSGGGGGGGGGASGRPVAVVIIGPSGVRVEPIVDVTKIALAALTTWGAMLPLLIRRRRGK